MAGLGAHHNVSDGHCLYYETWGGESVQDKPLTVLFLHGVYANTYLHVADQSVGRPFCLRELTLIARSPPPSSCPPLRARSLSFARPPSFAGVHESADTLTAHRLAAGFSARGHTFVALEHHGSACFCLHLEYVHADECRLPKLNASRAASCAQGMGAVRGSAVWWSHLTRW